MNYRIYIPTVKLEGQASDVFSSGHSCLINSWVLTLEFRVHYIIFDHSLLISFILNFSNSFFCRVLDLDAFERYNKAEGLGVSDGSAQAKNVSDTEHTCKLFRFLQLLCEGHNLGKNDLTNIHSVNCERVVVLGQILRQHNMYMIHELAITITN